MVFTKVIIAGSTGYIADPAIQAILASTDPVFDVTILTRAESRKSTNAPGAKLVPIDYYDHQALVRAVSGADAILSFISGAQAKAVDRLLLKAAQEAGVRPFTEGGNWPEETSPVVTARKFMDLANEGGPTSFTTIIPAAFMDGWLAGEFGSIDLKNRKVTAVDSGDHYFSGCTLPYLAAAIVAVLKMDEEKTKNKRIPITELRVTMNQIADTFEEVTGDKFERGLVISKELFDQRDTNLKAGNAFVALFTMVHMLAFNGSGAADMKDGLKFDGDGFLNLRKKTLKELCVVAVEKVGTA
ncbi:isoflavone reductase family protein [Penicillium atrosanguineum]|nr:isoflavone reductase family protein [Penicillium atrosanguineum]